MFLPFSMGFIVKGESKFWRVLFLTLKIDEVCQLFLNIINHHLDQQLLLFSMLSRGWWILVQFNVNKACHFLGVRPFLIKQP